MYLLQVQLYYNGNCDVGPHKRTQLKYRVLTWHTYLAYSITAVLFLHKGLMVD